MIALLRSLSDCTVRTSIGSSLLPTANEPTW